jgi:hypothetical protein
MSQNTAFNSERMSSTDLSDTGIRDKAQTLGAALKPSA